MARNHDHPHGSKRGTLIWVLLLNGFFLVVEFFGGLFFGSLALLADAAHMLTDVSGLVIALIGLSLMGRPSTQRHTFGLLRAEVMAGMVNGLLLIVTGTWIVVEAIRRWGQVVDLNAPAVLGVGLVGLFINVMSAAWLHGRRHDDLNMRGAYLHMATDALSSVAVVLVALVLWFGGWAWLDPLVSILIAGLVFWSAVQLVKDAAHVLLEGAPSSVDLDEASRCISGESGVVSVHHMHVWHLSTNDLAMSAHLVVGSEMSLHEAQLLSDRVSVLLASKFGISHATLAVECHECADDPQEYCLVR